MPNSNVPGASGIVFIVVGSLVVSVIITQVTGSYVHWLPVVLGLIVGLLTVRSINR